MCLHFVEKACMCFKQTEGHYACCPFLVVVRAFWEYPYAAGVFGQRTLGSGKILGGKYLGAPKKGGGSEYHPL